MALFGINKLKRKKRPPARIHRTNSEYASISLASASMSTFTQIAGTGSAWQARAWEYYDVVPEMRLVVSYRSAAISKVKIKLMLRTPDGDVQQTDDRSQAMLDKLFGGVVHHSAALARYAEHLTIVGESFTFIVPDPDTPGKDLWIIVPPDHVKVTGNIVQVTNPLSGQEDRYDLEVFNYRLWIPHPHRFWEADSPTRGGLSTLEKIQALDSAIRTAAMSRVAGAGVWFLPQELNLPNISTADGVTSGQDAFKADFHRNMASAITDQNSASRQSPMIAWGPMDVIKDIKDPIRMWSELDENASELRDAEIRRYASGQPLPTEMVTGVGKVNHWTGWQLSEEDLKFDIAPLTQLILDAVTLRVVAPIMGDNFFLEADFSDLVSRPDRTPEALQLREAGAITINELREQAGYDPLPTGQGDQLVPTPVDTTVRVPSTRVEAPQEIERAQDPAVFAVADMIARDLLHTSAQWVLTHSGRGNRAALASVEPLQRHMTFSTGRDVLEEAVGRVRPKYVGVVPDELFETVTTFVGRVLDAPMPYERNSLVRFLRGDW